MPAGLTMSDPDDPAAAPAAALPPTADTGPARGAARAGIALERCTMYITWLVPVLDKFPRSQRFLLGDRLQSLALDLVEALIEAQWQPRPRAALLQANLLLDKQRLLWRVAYNLRHADVRRYEHALRELDEIGRRVGAWLKKAGA